MGTQQRLTKEQMLALDREELIVYIDGGDWFDGATENADPGPKPDGLPVCGGRRER